MLEPCVNRFVTHGSGLRSSLFLSLGCDVAWFGLMGSSETSVLIILYYDQQMHNYFTNYHTLTSYTSISNAAVGNTIYIEDVSHWFCASSRFIVIEISIL